MKQVRSTLLSTLLAAALLGAAACGSAPEEDSVGTGREALVSYKYLSAPGIGTEASANAYYASIVPGFTPGTYTLSQWLNDFIPQDLPVSFGFYRNANDLGFWREMYCSTTISRGKGGCLVVNWRNEDDRPSGRVNLGTVAMNVSPEGYTRFYAFGPDEVLSPSVALDSEGVKFLPNLCLACHAGTSAPTGDQGSIFREFETALLTPPTGKGSLVVEGEWQALNQAVLTANAAIRTEQQGAAPGTDFAKSRIVDHITRDLYPDPSAPKSVPLGQQPLPPSWDGLPDTNGLQAAKTNLWRTVVAPSCMPCHRTLARVDWANYTAFVRLGKRVNGAPSFLERVMAPGSPRTMPQAELTSKNLAANTAAKPALDAWLSLVNAPSP